MKKLVVFITLFLLTGCIGSYNLENALENFADASSASFETTVVYHESEFTDYSELEYSYSEAIDWRNQRMKRYDIVNQTYHYYEMFSDGMGNVYEQDVDNEWYLAYEQIMVEQDFYFPEIKFVEENVDDFQRNFPMLNTYQLTADPMEFFDSDSPFYDVGGKVEFTVKVGGGHINEISYRLIVADETVFLNEANLVNIDQTYIDFPFVSEGDKRSFNEVFETMGERLLEAVESYYAMAVVEEELDDVVTFVIENSTLSDDSPDLSVRGRLPQHGVVEVADDGDVRMAIYENNYCLTKVYDSKELKITESKQAECKLP